MSNRLKGTIVGVLLSLLAVVAWVILAFIGIIAGLAGALMGILFIIGYSKINKEDKSKYPVIVACVLIIAEIVLAELLTIFIYAGTLDLSFGDALANSDVQSAMLYDILLGLAFSFLVFIGYLVSKKRKDKLDNHRYSAPINNQNPYQGNPGGDHQTPISAQPPVDPFAQQNQEDNKENK